MSAKRCCVPNCDVSRDDKIPMHCFPDPNKDPERFRSWFHNIGGEILNLDEEHVYKCRRVCHKHFDSQYHTWTRTLTAHAIPTVHLPGSSFERRPLSDIGNTLSSTEAMPEVASTSAAPPDAVAQLDTKENLAVKKVKAAAKKGSMLGAMIEKLEKQKANYATRLKKAMNLTTNKTFQNCLSKFTTLAALFTVMQFREFSKKKMGRRFTQKEKIMALSLYKQGPKAYRWLSKIFVLPSPLTLSRLISKVGLKPGINKKIFQQLKKRAEKMTDVDKLCILLFDEIAIMPHFDYNQKKDYINGFVKNGTHTQRKIADHALVFMLRGVIKNYKQPIAYTFCSATTPKEELKTLIKKVIAELQNCGFKVLATVCDQGATNVSAINSLVKDTKEKYLRQERTHIYETFEVNDEEVVPLFDTPHLIKGIRNNMLTKNLQCTIDGERKIAKWQHIQQLHEENPAYKGIRLIKNLSEAHVNPQKMGKMKVKLATQVFSKTVGTTMGYLADKGILPPECKDTADVLLFFDDLFDSMNGSYENSKRRTGKDLLGPVTPKSEHTQIWFKSKEVLRTMKFISKDGKEGSVPSIHNWLRTLESIEYLKNKIFDKYQFNSLWMRHFNQVPIENFFGCIRSHGARNISPTPTGFESAFASILIGNIASHSKGSNCEEDFCKAFDSMSNLFDKEDEEALLNSIIIDMEDVEFQHSDFEIKKQNSRIIAQLCYVAGYVLKQAKKNVFRNCSNCKKDLYDARNPKEYLIRREYFNFKRSLNYPCEKLVRMFSDIQEIITNVLEKKVTLKI